MYPAGFYRSKETSVAKPSFELPDSSRTKSPVEKQQTDKPESAEKILRIILKPLPQYYQDIDNLLSKARADEPDLPESYTVLRVLTDVNIAVWYDAEAGVYPVPYG